MTACPASFAARAVARLVAKGKFHGLTPVFGAPPRSEEDRYKFCHDYLSISVHRGIFVIAE